MGMIEQLVALLHSDHSPFHEHVLSQAIAYKSIHIHPRAQAECLRPELHLKALLDQREQLITGKAEYQVLTCNYLREVVWAYHVQNLGGTILVGKYFAVLL